MASSTHTEAVPAADTPFVLSVPVPAESSPAPFAARTEGYVDCLTQDQKSALKQLVSALPGAIHDAALTANDLTLWGVRLDELAGVGEHAAAGQPTPSRVQTVVLLKWLRARQWNVDAALAMLVKCLKWRRDFDIAGLAHETFPQQLAAAGQLSGRDRAGNPVTYNYYGGAIDLPAFMAGPGGVATFVRWRIKLMEQAVALLDFDAGEHVTQVHDYEGASLMRMNANTKAATRQIINLFQDNYPEMLSAKLFLNVPRVMEFLFSVISAFVDPATRTKFVMASAARAREVLLQYVDPVYVPSRFGGWLENFGVPPKGGLASSFACSSKSVILQPGDSHVTAMLVGPGSEVAWGFCTSKQPLRAYIVFRPEDHQEAAAAAALLPDHVSGSHSPHTPEQAGRDAALITQSHVTELVRDAAGGRLLLGCAGEVNIELEHSVKTGGGLFSSGPSAVTVHYALAGCGTGLSPPRAGRLQSVGRRSSELGGALESRIVSYKSLGCSSLASMDTDQGRASTCGEPSEGGGAAARTPPLSGQPLGGRFEPVHEVEEEGASVATPGALEPEGRGLGEEGEAGEAESGEGGGPSQAAAAGEGARQ